MNKYSGRPSCKTFARRGAAIFAAGVVLFIVILSFGDGKGSPNLDTLADVFGMSRKYPKENDYIRFLDVGEGDAALLCSNGKTALIDTGPEDSADKLCSKLRSYGVKQLDLLIFSHAHTDHVGGSEEILSTYAVGCIVVPYLIDEPEGTAQIINAEKTVSKNGGTVYSALNGMQIKVGDFTLEVIGYYPDMEDENDRSVFIMAEIRGMKFLFTGDAEASAEKRLIEENTDISCDVLKVGHHGSSTSSCEEFLTACSPREAVISCGYGNSYLHPHEKAVERLENSNATVYRTDIYGDICFEIEAKQYKISVKK